MTKEALPLATGTWALGVVGAVLLWILTRGWRSPLSWLAWVMRLVIWVLLLIATLLVIAGWRG